jgi:copper chaperone CopZ
MKAILFISSILLAFGITLSSWTAPEKKTIEFSVNGNCEMCKRKIEGALSIKGVRAAEWDINTKRVKVVYVPSVISEDQIHQAIADSGYDTDQVKAKDEVYEKLHTCCLYRNEK